MNKKDRRKSGWVTPRIVQPTKYDKLIEDCLEPQPYYDEWVNYRDGQRDKSYFEWKKRDKKKRRKRR